MANKKNININESNSKTNNSKKQNSNTNTIKNIEKKEMKNNSKNEVVMKTLVFIGVLIFCFIIIYLMYHFFVEKSDIKINMSTDKQIEYITIEGTEELIMTQKYVSDLGYSMRYDVTDFKVFKYKTQDIYKNLNDERVLVVVEKSQIPSNCTTITSTKEYNNCYIKVDNYTEENYISSKNQVYKITIKTPGTTEYLEGTRVRIEHMLNTFSIMN